MGGLSRRQKESRAYSLVLVGSGSGIATVVLGVLAIFGVGSFGLAFLTLLIALGAFFLFKRTTGT